MRQAVYVAMVVVLATGCASARTKHIKVHPEMPVEHIEVIKAGSLVHGLTKTDVKMSLGKPVQTYGYTRDGRWMELWVYSEFKWEPFQNVLFENGYVVGWNLPESVKKRLDDRSVADLLEPVPDDDMA